MRIRSCASLAVDFTIVFNSSFYLHSEKRERGSQNMAIDAEIEDNQVTKIQCNKQHY